MTERRCENCEWWRKIEPGHTYADCRRQPPQFNFSVNVRHDAYGRGQDQITVSRFPNGQWPNVAHDDWCGEFQRARRARALAEKEKGDA